MESAKTEADKAMSWLVLIVVILGIYSWHLYSKINAENACIKDVIASGGPPYGQSIPDESSYDQVVHFMNNVLDDSDTETEACLQK